jgi:XapX domain-containing protein
MRPLFVSFAVGLGVGVLYGLLHVKSPAPPIVALLGLLGMVIGEQIGTWRHTTTLDVSQATPVYLLGAIYRRPHSREHLEETTPAQNITNATAIATDTF